MKNKLKSLEILLEEYPELCFDSAGRMHIDKRVPPVNTYQLHTLGKETNEVWHEAYIQPLPELRYVLSLKEIVKKFPNYYFCPDGLLFVRTDIWIEPMQFVYFGEKVYLENNCDKHGYYWPNELLKEQ